MKATSQKLQAAIIGYGISGELSHAYGLSANPDTFDIVAVCDLSEVRRKQAVEKLGCRAYASHSELIAEEADLDLACVITRSDTHSKIAGDFLKAGISCLITKPWVLNRKEAEALVLLQKESNARVFPWVPMYWSNEFRKIRDLIGSGSIGNVFMIRRQLTDYRRRTDWQTELKYGGGYLLNWGPHIVQPLVALANSTPRRIVGFLQKIFNPGDADDAFLSIIEFDNGILAMAEFTQACDSSLPSFFVQGDQGTIRSDGKMITLSQKDPSETTPAKQSRFPIEGKVFGDEAEIYRDIAECLRGRRSYSVSLDDALLNTSLLDSIRASHDTNETVRLAIGT